MPPFGSMPTRMRIGEGLPDRAPWQFFLSLSVSEWHDQIITHVLKRYRAPGVMLGTTW
ncbi:MAG: hypothetical protein H5T66_04835 [Chloroflexi bacterium]|nr:hypothetical protein [Chloroflexota bacterium]